MSLSRHVPELSALELLLAVARTGSLNAAARMFGITQQAASSRISSMETQTGVPLLIRTTHGSSLTPAGVVVCEWASRLVDIAGELDAGLAVLRQDRRAHLRITASLTIAEHLLPGWLVSLTTAARRRGADPPETVLTAANSDVAIDDVRHERADIGFVEGPTTPRDLHSRVVAHDTLAVVVRPDHPWARRRRPVTVAELKDTPLVSREPGSGTRESLAAALRNALGPQNVQAAPLLAMSTTAAVRSAVLAGAGPAVLSELAVKDDVYLHRLHRVEVIGVDLRRALRAIWIGPRQPPAGATRDLVTHIVALSRGTV